ncbi:MAG TPA: hypothetical protein VFG10_07020 [Saprospiraceae bacterium]|nr:hypothetical protein [Saprospiraceae bacterium]
MKNNFITRLLFGMVLCMFSMTIQAQTKTVNLGTVSNNVATLTNQIGAVNVLKANLPANATVIDVKLEYSQYDAAYYLTGVVTNDAISSVGIKLNQNGSTLYAAAGPGVEITCVGVRCGMCRLNFRKWSPFCECTDPAKDSESECNMISKYILSF